MRGVLPGGGRTRGSRLGQAGVDGAQRIGLEVVIPGLGTEQHQSPDREGPSTWLCGHSPAPGLPAVSPGITVHFLFSHLVVGAHQLGGLPKLLDSALVLT